MNTFKLYEQLKATFPQESAEALAHVLSEVVESVHNTVTREDFSQLKAVVADLGQAQKRTEERLDTLSLRMEELAAAQKRTEERVDLLAQRMEELAAAQKRTEERLDKLVRSQDFGFKRMDMYFSRGGMEAESAFREGLRELLRETGFTVEAYRGQDPEGFINHDPGRSYEMDIVVRNGTTLAVEIKSSATSSDVTIFHRMVRLFEQQTQRKVNRQVMVVIAPRPEAWEKAQQLGVVLRTNPETVAEP